MKCESFRNRLLALPSPAAPTPELAAHMATCAGCRAFAARAGKLAALLAALPVPSSEVAKLAFVESLAVVGPVIQTKPTAPSADPHSGTFRPFRALARRVEAKHVIGIAAALLVAISAWLLWPAGKPPVAEQDGPRQELLAKQNRHLADLASANSADVRLRVWADWTGDLRAATADVYMAADPEDFEALEKMFEKAIRVGVLGSAEKLPPLGAARTVVLLNARDKVGAARAELERMSKVAPPTHQARLQRMEAQARDAQQTLTRMAEGV